MLELFNQQFKPNPILMYKVLVVDDSSELLELFSIILTMEGFKVEAVASKEKLQKQLSKFVPDLILLDVQVNGHDERALCQEIKRSTHIHIPTILVASNPTCLKDYEACGACDIIEKPFDIKTVIQKINKALKKDLPLEELSTRF